MPKGKFRVKVSERRKAEHVLSDEDSANDNASVTSSVSDVKSFVEDGGEQELEEQLEQDCFEDKLKDAVDGLTQKSAICRKSCLEVIIKSLTSRYIYDFVIDRRLTILDGIERCLKKGRSDEQALSARVVALLCIQLGAGDESDDVFRAMKPMLMLMATDKSVSHTVRAMCLSTLSLCTFITNTGQDCIHEVLAILEETFGGSYLKGNGVTPNHAPELCAVHNAALSAWSLLLTLLSPSHLLSKLDSVLYKLPELLESADVDVRITAGDAIAVFYEILREKDETFEGEDFDELCEKLKELATDAHKYHAKKDRQQQRSSFRDVLKLVEDNMYPHIQIKFGREVLLLSSWCRKRQYDAVCQILASGMNLHLAENALLRDIFDLGPSVTVGGKPLPKVSKFERHMVNVAAFRARTIAMNKVRDKRVAVF